MKVGLIGAGVMGGGMGRRVLAEGNELKVFDLDGEAVAALVERGAERAGSPAAAAAGSDYVITSLPRNDDVRAAIGGADGVLDGMGEGAIAIETSTVSPAVVKELAPRLREKGAAIVDAPVVTAQSEERRPIPADVPADANIGRQSSTAGNLGFLIGGDEAAVAGAMPLLEVLGIEHHHVGPLGAGAMAKLINNAIVGTEVALLSEMMAIARRSGLELGPLVETLSHCSSNSVILNSHIRRFTVEDNFPPGLFPVDYMVKDLGLAMEVADEAGVDCEVSGAALELFKRAAAAGLGGTYNPVVIRVVEGTADGQGQ